MALIKDSNPKDVSGGYMRVFDDEELGLVLSKVQSAVIRAGKELENIIKDQTQTIDDLDEFLKLEIMPDGVFVANKSQMKDCNTLNFAGSDPDFIIFGHKDNRPHCYIVELKDGHNFDTKKAPGEHRSMRAFVSENAPRLPCTSTIHFCAFNKDNREEIVKGFKNAISKEEAMTGREFCELLELNYDEIVESRRGDGEENITYFVSELVKVRVVREELKKYKDNI